VEAKRSGLAGFEFLEGIPGSVGGALRMNAGAMGGSMFDVVISVRAMDFSGSVHDRAPSEMAVSYRCCSTLRTEIALQALLRGRIDSRELIEKRMNEFSRRRWETQPAASSAGCMFKNPPSIPAGKLIDELGLKGTRVGGAMVSLEHGNFLVNDGTATAKDVLALIEVVRARARAERGIELETEVEIIGE
jgi:UDP-N-acetylenolpyruvoylglucosamine reductase